MGKSVMISIKPKWCEHIALGEKTVEIRKTRPKLETPFKCYIYCTENGNAYNPNQNFWKTDSTGFNHLCNGRVIGEFVCERIYTIVAISPLPWGGSKGSWAPFNPDDACLSVDEIESYIDGNNGYGWHISNLVIYDKPKELSEFSRWEKSGEDIRPCQNGKKCQHVIYDYIEDCEACDIDFDGTNCPYYKVQRPPQSWCYVESL